MEKKKIVYVTGNKMKVDFLKSVLNSDEFEVEAKKIECPEIQADSVVEVAAFSAKYACDLLGQPVLKNDSALVIEALNGFPSVYAKYVQHTLGAEGILRLMKGKENRTCYYYDAFAYAEPNKEPVVFTCKTYGKISNRQSGKNGDPYDKIFIADSKTKTMANLSYEKFLSCFDNSAVYELVNYLKTKEQH